MKLFRCLMIVCLLATAACRLGPEGGISWDSELLAPIAYTKLGVFDAVSDSLFEASSDGLLRITYRDTLSNTYLGETFTLPDTTLDLTVGLDTLTLSSDTIAERVTLRNLANQLVASGDPLGALLLASDGQTLPFPGIDNQSSGAIPVPVSDRFEFAILESGRLTISIENQFPTDLENVIFRISNFLGGDDIVRDTFGVIPAGQTRTREYDLAGKEIENALVGELVNLDLAAGPPPAQLVTIDLDDYVELRLVAEELRASEARAIFPAQVILDTIRNTTYNNFSGDFDAVELTKVLVKSGRIEAYALSTVQDSVLFEYALLGARGADGTVPRIRLKMPPAPSDNEAVERTEIFELDGFELDLTGEGTTFNTLQEQIIVTLLESGKLVTLNQEDSVSVSFGLLDLEPIYVEGYIGQQRIEFTGEESLDDLFGDLAVDRIRFSEAQASLVLGNSIGVDAQVELRDFTAINSQSGQRVKLTGSPLLAGPIEVLGPNLPDTNGMVMTPVLFTPQNSNVSLFAGTLPDRIEYDLTVATNLNAQPGVRDNFATDNSRFSAFIDLELPLAGVVDRLRLRDTVEADWSSIESPEQVQRGKLSLLLENDFPLEVRVTVTLLDQNNEPITTLIEGRSLAAALVGADGRTTQAASSVIDIEASSEQIEDWTARTRSVMLDFTLNTRPQGQSVRIYADYQIAAKLTGQFTYRVSN